MARRFFVKNSLRLPAEAIFKLLLSIHLHLEVSDCSCLYGKRDNLFTGYLFGKSVKVAVLCSTVKKEKSPQKCKCGLKRKPHVSLGDLAKRVLYGERGRWRHTDELAKTIDEVFTV